MDPPLPGNSFLILVHYARKVELGAPLTWLPRLIAGVAADLLGREQSVSQLVRRNVACQEQGARGESEALSAVACVSPKDKRASHLGVPASGACLVALDAGRTR